MMAYAPDGSPATTPGQRHPPQEDPAKDATACAETAGDSTSVLAVGFALPGPWSSNNGAPSPDALSAAESSTRQAASGGLLLGSENPVDCLFALDATADGPHGPAKGEELLAREGVHEVRTNTADMRRGHLDDRGRPASVSTSSTPRRSPTQASRRTHPRFSRRPAVWVNRLRDCTTCSAIADIRSRRSGASESTAMISYSVSCSPWAWRSRSITASSNRLACRYWRQACCSSASSHCGSGVSLPIDGSHRPLVEQ